MPGKKRRRSALSLSTRIERLAAVTSSRTGVTRLYLSEEHKQAADLVSTWMAEAGMDVSIDAAGSVIGRFEGRRNGARAIVLGSALDTPPNAGKYSGSLGVLLAIETIASMRRKRIVLPHAIEVVALGEDHANRFCRTSQGSRALAGLIEPSELDETDRSGISLRAALEQFGCEPGDIPDLRRNPANLLGYVELLPEQGRLLDEEGVPIGVVTAFSGRTGLSVTVTGAFGQSCGLAFADRRDALAAASEMILSVESIGRQTAGLASTVTAISTEPSEGHMIAGRTRLFIEVRSPVDRTRRAGQREIERSLKAIARRRHCKVDIQTVVEKASAPCDARYISQLSAAVERAGHTAFGLPTCAGTGGAAFSRLGPVGMLLIRSKAGVSQHPNEMVRLEDIECARKVLLDFLSNLDMIGAR